MTSKEERNARARDNQRLSRARRLDYIATLEEKIRHYEKGRIVATQEMQASARIVEKQNALLRTWLCKVSHVSENDLQEWVKLPPQVADEYFMSAMNRMKRQPLTIRPEPHYQTSPSRSHIPIQAVGPRYASESPISETYYQSQVSARSSQISFQAPLPANSIGGTHQNVVPNAMGAWTEPRYDMTAPLLSSSFPKSKARRHSNTSQYHFDQHQSPGLTGAFVNQIPTSNYSQAAAIGAQQVGDASPYSQISPMYNNRQDVSYHTEAFNAPFVPDPEDHQF